MRTLDFAFRDECVLHSESSGGSLGGCVWGRGALGGGDGGGLALIPCLLRIPESRPLQVLKPWLREMAFLLENQNLVGVGARWLKWKSGSSLLIFLAVVAVRPFGARIALCVALGREGVTLGVCMESCSWFNHDPNSPT